MSATTSCDQVGTVLMASQILFASSCDGTVPLKYSLPSRSSAEPSILKPFAVSMASWYLSRNPIDNPSRVIDASDRLRRVNPAGLARHGRAAEREPEHHDDRDRHQQPD